MTYKLSKKIKSFKDKDMFALQKYEKAKALLSRGCKREANILLNSIISEFEGSVTAILAVKLLSQLDS